MPIDLETELDRLYGVELEKFVPERTELAKALRKEGRRAEAAQVQELRKPSLPAWTVNQLSRKRRKDVDLLLDASHRLASTQRSLGAGGERAPFEEARSREQAALKRLVAEAHTILGDRATPGMLERVSSTLRAAAASDATRPDLARGRLTGDLSLSGFDVLAGAQGLERPARRPKAETPARTKAAPRAAARGVAVDRARSELEAAQEQRTRVAKQLRDADKALRAARRSYEQELERKERLDAEHEKAEARVAAARAKLDAARER